MDTQMIDQVAAACQAEVTKRKADAESQAQSLAGAAEGIAFYVRSLKEAITRGQTPAAETASASASAAAAPAEGEPTPASATSEAPH